VASVPAGRVMTYGDIATWCGSPGAGRVVGAIAASGSADLPWHRVVLSGGRLARRGYGDMGWQVDSLAEESVVVRDGRIIDFKVLCWQPED